ncbi:hypothetical protein IEZ26_10510 [Nocardioides cavernae]|uniref:DUF998 domain-containing protein n=1 Tax=Nocardioides cavernae TaxID=1921566 RepID=A0ABR8NAA6_9ACTN|nr:hypothetical protein [Nocardioides cavernae]MBD3925053.1 hypothetical protein [Nocardioides cavernae]MBM7514573.1 hypothetical protein [Nocardioides cavernae]
MRGLVRAAVAALIALAGALWVAAAAQRWWPACKLGDFDAVACIQLQDHLYDYVAPTAPWVAVGNAAQLAGVAMTLLAIGVTLLPWLWLPRRPLVCLAVAFPALSVLLIGGSTWHAGLSHEALAAGVLPTILVWSFGLPIALALAAATSRDDHTARRTTRWRVVVTVLIAMATPLAELIFAPILLGYMSHDSTPWTGAVTGALLVAAGCAVWPATSGPRRPSAARTSAGRGRRSFLGEAWEAPTTAPPGHRRR